MADASLPDGHTTTDGFIDCPQFPAAYTTMVNGCCGACKIKITDEVFIDEHMCGSGSDMPTYLPKEWDWWVENVNNNN